MAGTDPIHSEATQADEPEYDRSVYCTVCHKPHVVQPDEPPCEPGAWLEGGEPWPTDHT